MYSFYVWVILHCVYVPQLSYPFICWWTSRLLPCPGYYKQCCDEHWGTRVSFPSCFLSVYAQQWDCWIIRQVYFTMFILIQCQWMLTCIVQMNKQGPRDGLPRSRSHGWQGMESAHTSVHFNSILCQRKMAKEASYGTSLPGFRVGLWKLLAEWS